jgi:uncharacterized protein (TIGR02145 family)
MKISEVSSGMTSNGLVIFRIAISLLIFMILMLNSSCRSCKKEKDSTPVAAVETTVDQIVKDQDGHVYHAVTIGKQVWLAENLRSSHFRNGDVIPDVTSDRDWRRRTGPAMCNYDNNAANASVYGSLYNWYAVNDRRNICPEGWHVPSDEEWFQLINYLGGERVAGGKLKESASGHWLIPNTGATNESGFTALPGGYRGNMGTFQILDTYAFYWTATGLSDENAWSWFLQNDSEAATHIENLKSFGFSIRCIKNSQ